MEEEGGPSEGEKVHFWGGGCMWLWYMHRIQGLAYIQLIVQLSFKRFFQTITMGHFPLSNIFVDEKLLFPTVVKSVKNLSCFVCFQEAVNTYEGTHDIHALIVGRAITGIQAFS